MSTFFSRSLANPLLVRLAPGVIGMLPLCLRGMPLGTGIALLTSNSCLPNVPLRHGVERSSSRYSSTSICDTLCECP